MTARQRRIRYGILAAFFAALAAIIAWAWYDSTRGIRFIQYRRISYHAGAGVFSFAWHPPLLQTPWTNRRELPPPGAPPIPLRWFPYPQPHVSFMDPKITVSPNLMFWWFFAPSFLICAICSWRFARRPFSKNACQDCGYDLTGNVSGVCPECSAAVTPAPPGSTQSGARERADTI